MSVVILGAGSLGSYLASSLAKEEYSVTLIDKDSAALSRISRDEDIATLCSSGSRWEILDDLLDNNPSLFAAMTGDDETNLVACSIAKNLGYPVTIARVKNLGFLSRGRLDFEKLFSVDHFIAAEILASHDLLKRILHPEDLAIENFAHGSIQMRTIVVPEKWDKGSVPISKLRLPDELIISLIKRKDIPPIFPHGSDVIKAKDEVTIIGEAHAMQDLHKVFYTPKQNVHSVVIAGGSAIAVNLASLMEKQEIKVKIIEKREARCHELAELLPKSTIVNQDATDLNFLTNEQIKETDTFIPCTTRDEKNILLALLAKEAGCQKIVSLISDTKLSPILEKLSIKYSFSEKLNTINKIISILHAESIVSVASLCNDEAKVLEVKVSLDSKLVGIPLADLKGHLPPDMLIAAIENRGQVMIGKGKRMISPNDTLIIITSHKNLPTLKDIF